MEIPAVQYFDQFPEGHVSYKLGPKNITITANGYVGIANMIDSFSRCLPNTPHKGALLLGMEQTSVRLTELLTNGGIIWDSGKILLGRDINPENKPKIRITSSTHPIQSGTARLLGYVAKRRNGHEPIYINGDQVYWLRRCTSAAYANVIAEHSHKDNTTFPTLGIACQALMSLAIEFGQGKLFIR